MENKNYKKTNPVKLFLASFFVLTTIFSYGQVDAPPTEVPIDNNIILMFGIAILFALYFFIKNYKTVLTQKINILKNSTFNKTIAIAAFLMLIATNSKAQNAASWGNIYVHDNGQMHVFTTDFHFMTQNAPAAGTKTSRTASTYGKISFADAVVVNATNLGIVTDQHYIDGYFRKYGTTAIVMPIGNSSVYAPAKVVPTTVDGVDGAYYRANPTTVGSTLDSGLSAISTVEYWHILRASGSSSNAKISLSWRSSSNVATLTTSSLSDLTIAGWDGSKWVSILSTFDSTNVTDVAGSDSASSSSTSLTEGSITSNSNVDLSAYQYFTLASKPSCMPLVTSSGNTKTWNGTAWSPSAPTIADPVIINGTYSGNLSCNSLTLNNDITLANGELLEVVYGITGTGKIFMASEASLVQRDNSVAGSANIELIKESRSVMHWRDYMYYGTPISGNFYSQIATNTWNTGFASTFGSFDLAFNYTVGTGWGPLPVGGVLTNPAVQTNSPFTIVTGKGFIARIKQNSPWVAGTSTTTPTNTGQVNFKFAGTANSGTITVPVSVNATKPYELLANPYPSAVDAQKFLTTNTNVDGNIYVWSAASIRTCAANNCTYAGADYAQWNLAGATNTSPIGQKVDGKIASGQGFRIKANSGTTVTWDNCMRLTTGNNNFFRQSDRTNTTVDRFNLNIQDNNDKGLYNQILVAYIPEATYAIDRLYDGEKYSTSETQLYTLQNGKKFGINGRGTFVDNDIVPMGISNTSTEQEFTISIESKEGIFVNDVYVYIHDKLNNVYHDLATPFVFNANTSSTNTTVNDRFEIVYQRNTLHNNDYLANETLIKIKDATITVKTKEIGMTGVEVYDITGRKVQSFDLNNAKSMTEPFNHAEGIYIAKVKLENGSVSTQKLINKK